MSDLYTLTSIDRIHGHDDETFPSEPRPLEQILILSRMLGGGRLTGPGYVHVAIPHGQRHITISPAQDGTNDAA